MMDFNHSVLFLFICLLEYIRSSKVCYENARFMRHGFQVYFTRNYCCLTNFTIINDVKCIECSKGYMATNNNTCIPCDKPRYGDNCLKQCRCNDIQICDHIKGCIFSFKSTDAGKSSQYSKGTEWPEKLTTHFDNTSFTIVKSTNRPSVNQQKEPESLSSNLIVYVMCTGSLALIIGLSILFRQYYYRLTNTMCWKTKNIQQIENHRYSNYDDEFQEDIFELERHGSVYDLIDEQSMVANIEHLQDDIPFGPDNIYEFAFD